MVLLKIILLSSFSSELLLTYNIIMSKARTIKSIGTIAGIINVKKHRNRQMKFEYGNLELTE